MPTPPVRVAPTPSPRGVEARPFRPPGDPERQGRYGRSPGAGADDARRGPGFQPQPVPPAIAEGSRRGGAPMPQGTAPIGIERREPSRAAPSERVADEDFRRGPAPGATPQMRAAPDDRRRDPTSAAQSLPAPRPQTPATPLPNMGAHPTAVAPRPAPVAPAPAPQVAPAMRSGPPQAMPQQAMPQQGMPQQHGGAERRRERPEVAGTRPPPRSEPPPTATPAQPRIAPAAPPPAARPERAAPPAPAPAQVAPAVRPAEAPRARGGPPERRPSRTAAKGVRKAAGLAGGKNGREGCWRRRSGDLKPLLRTDPPNAAFGLRRPPPRSAHRRACRLAQQRFEHRPDVGQDDRVGRRDRMDAVRAGTSIPNSRCRRRPSA
jgi:hypothetical protein